MGKIEYRTLEAHHEPIAFVVSKRLSKWGVCRTWKNPYMRIIFAGGTGQYRHSHEVEPASVS
jgi:hypothetical protein